MDGLAGEEIARRSLYILRFALAVADASEDHQQKLAVRVTHDGGAVSSVLGNASSHRRGCPGFLRIGSSAH